MIYSVYWGGVPNINRVHHAHPKEYITAAATHGTYNPYADTQHIPPMTYNPREFLRDGIKGTSDNTFVFILVGEQLEDFNKWIKAEGLEEYVVYRMPQPITNGIQNRRRLTLAVLCSLDHVWRDMYQLEGEENAEN